MAILKLLYRKMWNNRWLTFSLLIGLIFAVALTTSIPLYTDGSLKRLLDQEIRKETTGLSAGALIARYQAVASQPPKLEEYQAIHRYFTEEAVESIGLEVKRTVHMVGINPSQILPIDREKIDPTVRRDLKIEFYTDFAEQIDLVEGRLYSSELTNGFVEAIATDEALLANDMHIGDEFYVYHQRAKGNEPIKIKIVGTYAPKLEEANYWYMGLNALNGSLMVHEDVFTTYILEELEIPLAHTSWYYDFDLTDLTMGKASYALRALEAIEVRSNQILPYTQLPVTFRDLLTNYREQGWQLQTMLFSLAAPILVLVLYYIIMTSRESLERQRGEIALLRSRGASTGQIFWLYLLESLLLGGVALAIGPPLGYLMAKMIGSSDGFLTFVQRKPLELQLTLGTYAYGLLAVLAALLATVLPALQAAKSSIVHYKQQSVRLAKKPIWQRFFLDLVLLGVAGYGWYTFMERKDLLMRTGLRAEDLTIHPLLFFVPSICLLASGLVMLRLFPWLIRLISLLGKRFTGVTLHLTLLQVSRSAKQYYPVMILLVLTVGLGIYSSSAARTIAVNDMERLRYAYGADVIMQSIWEQEFDFPTSRPDQPGQSEAPRPGQPPGQGFPPSGNYIPEGRYIEPPFEIFKEMPGVEHAARVFVERGSASVGGKSLGQAMIMGIDIEDFAQVAWFKRKLLPIHQNHYLNALGQDEAAVIVSQAAANRYGLKPGDTVRLTVNRASLDGLIVAAIPYWPRLYPDEMPFFIANLNYIQEYTPLAPYEVWLKMKEDALVQPVIDALAEKNIYLVYAKDVRNEIRLALGHPARAGVYGILSLGFLVAVTITLVGFILYWVFALQSRTVQFGVLRAMGMSTKQLLAMLFSEQLLTAGFAVGIGVGLGQLVSLIYLPFLELGQDPKKLVPPFQVVFEQSDFIRLYVVLFFMLALGLLLLIYRLSKLRIHQAVKLGEER